MDIRILIVLVVICFSSCRQPKVERYDSIRTTLYDNKYNQNNQLLEVKITEQTEIDVNGRYIIGDISHRTIKYDYTNGDTCRITTRKQKPNDYSVEKRGKGTNEFIIIEDSDTTEYHRWLFADDGKQKPLLIRNISRFSSFVSDMQINKNLESHYYYDDKGVNSKIIERDFNSNEVSEAYIFKGLSFNEATKQLPKSKNKQRVVCWIEAIDGDTIINSSYIDNVLSVTNKKYMCGNKHIEEMLDENNKLASIVTQYRDNDIDIKISQTLEQNLIDSIYSVNGKEIRFVSIYPDSKSITTFEYDKNGNITKEIKKSKADVVMSNTIFNN